MTIASPYALVTGANGRIGSAIVSRLRADGWTIEAPGRDTCDLADPTAVTTYLDAMESSVNAFVHAAGINRLTELSNADTHALNQAWRINCSAFIQIAKGLHADPRHNLFSAVAIGSLYARFGRSRRLPYVTSKHALLGAVKVLAIELAPYGVRVNSVSPGFVDTDMTRRNISASGISDLLAGIPMGRLGDATEIAGTVAFLLGDDSAYVTGQDLVVDGGYAAGGFLQG